MSSSNSLFIGWAQADITPPRPALLAGQFSARRSEGVRDPLEANALALQSGDEHVVFVSCDLVSISDELTYLVRENLRRDAPEMDALKVILSATHTHDAPEIRSPEASSMNAGAKGSGVELDAMTVPEYIAFAAQRIAEAIGQAWRSRATGGIAYGQSYAVLARNRRWVDTNGVAMMHGLNADSAARFDYVEGYEDHSINLLATYDDAGTLTGILLNTPCTAQAEDQLFEVSADFWHEARQELRARFGQEIFILSQVSAAGELTPIQIYEKAADTRMRELRGRNLRQELSQRLADAVGEILPYLAPAITREAVLEHIVETIELPVNALSEADVENARREAAKWQQKYEAELQKLEENPALKNEPRWYVPATFAYRSMNWHNSVEARFHQQQTQPTYAAELHVVRLGEIVFASNPFEYYLDFGIQIKVKSPATQTFLVELCGAGSYVPSARSVRHGGYGSMPASNRIGPEGGQVMAEWTVEKLRDLWREES
jgi:hypothetical protein